MVMVIARLLLGENHRLRGWLAVKLANAAPKRGAMLLAALRAMAIQRRRQRPGDLEFDAAAQAAAADGA
jgi:hypothetical protein